MGSFERQQEIIKYLKQNHGASVKELSEMLFIGPASIRRDLAKMEKRNLIARTYGGCVLVDSLVTDIPVRVRKKENYELKKKIARLAADYIQDNDILFFDSSTTTAEIIPYIAHKKNLTIITNGITTASLLGEQQDCSIYCCGGKIRPKSMSLIGDSAKAFLKKYHIQKMFFSSRAYSVPHGPIDASEDEAELRKAAIQSSRQVFYLCDHKKFQIESFYSVCSPEEIHCLITDEKPQPTLMKHFAEHHIQVVYPKENGAF